MDAVGRGLDEIELIGGTRATFDGPDSVADVASAFADVERQIERGYSTFCMKPSQYTDDLGEVREICHRMVELVSGFDVSACPGVTAP